MRHLITEICFALLITGILSALAGAADTPLLPAGISVNADSISHDEEKDILQARGHVVVKWDGYTLLSDSVLVKQEENEAFADGKPILKKEGIEFAGDRMKINYETQLGEADNGSLFAKQRNFHVRGDRFFKTGQDDYRVERGTFTTCDGDSPSWRFTATNLDVKVDDYATGKDAVFYVGEIPLFYSPYILFPVTRERQSGFLFPRFGNSTKKGINLDIPYYWAISPSQELTLDLDSQTKRGEGLGFDYSYLGTHESNGHIKGYLIYDTQKEWVRGDLTVKQQEALSPSFMLTSDLRLSLDRDFYRDYGEVNGDYNRQLLDSTIFLTKNWMQSSLAVEGRYVENLDSPTNQDTMQKLPSITFTRTRGPIGTTPLYFGFDSNFTNFYRETGVRGQRLDLHPTLSYYQTFSPGIDFSVWGGYRQRLYDGYGSEPAGVDQNIIYFPWISFPSLPLKKDTFIYRGRGVQEDGLFDGGASLSAPLARVYTTGGSDLLAVRHTLIPQMSYNLVEEKSQNDLPFFDWKDRIPGQQMLTWSLTNFVTGKYADAGATPAYRDILYLRLSEGYQLSGIRRDLLTLVDDGRRFTDLRLEARYALAKRLAVNVDTRYNPYRSRFSTASLRLDLDDGKGDLAGLGYQFERDQVRYLEGKVTLALIKPISFKYTCRYSFDKGNFLETDYSLEYKKQCWSLTMAYQDRQANKQFVVSFTLAGIGSLGPLRTF